MKTILFIFGTRPEAIKCIPIIKELQNSPHFNCKVCVTSQHQEMLHDVLTFFNIQPDINLNIMSHNQTITEITTRILTKLTHVFNDVRPDIVIVQGDTSSAFSGALAAHYHRIPIAHIEAGLRTYKEDPFPEEANRRLISHLATFHFCPTESAKSALNKEGIHENIHIVGNTVIDALKLGSKKINPKKNTTPSIVVTCHRRENIGNNLINICDALIEISAKHPSTNIIFPIHLNKQIKTVVTNKLSQIPNITLCAPLSYSEMISEMANCTLILTDSGGIQEEAASLGKPVLILRTVTERTEGIEQNIAKLIGTEKNTIINETERLLNNAPLLQSMSTPSDIYGDGNSSKKIIQILTNHYK